MAQPQHQPETGSWPLQLDVHLNCIKETFTRLSQELNLTRRERDDYKAQLDAQAKELDDFRFVGLRTLRGDENSFENDELFTASPATSEYYSPLDEVGQSVADVNQETGLYRNDIPVLQANPTTGVFDSLLDDSNNKATSEKLLDLKRVYTLREGDVTHVRFSPDGKFLGTVCKDGVTKIYETETGNNVYVLFDWYLADKYTQAEKSIKGVDLETFCFSPDNRYLATAGTDLKIRIWEIGKKGIRNILKGHILYPSLLDFLSNGRFIVSGSRDSNVRLWNMRTGIPTIFKGSRSGIWSVRSSPDGRYIAAGTTNIVLIWVIRSRALNCSLEHPGFVIGVEFTQDGMRLVTGSSEGMLKLWDISSLMLAEQQGLRGQQDGTVGSVQCLRNFVDVMPGYYVWTISLSCDGQWVLYGKDGRGAFLWDTRNANHQCVVQVPQVSAPLVAFSPMDDYLAVGTSGISRNTVGAINRLQPITHWTDGG